MYESDEGSDRLAADDRFEFEPDGTDTLYNWSLRDFCDILPPDERTDGSAGAGRRESDHSAMLD